MQQKYFLPLILLLAFGIRFYRLDTYGLYFDEKVTLLVSQAISPEGANQQEVFSKKYFTNQHFWQPKTLADFNEAVARGDWGNSPIHYAYVQAWTIAFGLSDFSVRLSSLLWSVALVWLLFVFVKKHFQDTKLAILVAFLACFEPLLVAQSHILRNYSMSLFLTLWATHQFLNVVATERTSWKHIGLYSLAVSLSLGSHYLTFPVFLCQGLYALLFVRNLQVWKKLLLSALLPAGLLGIWLLWGGGQYSLKTMGDVAAFYKNIAQNPPNPNPYKGIIDPATLKNIWEKLSLVLSDSFILSNNAASPLQGFKNILLCGISTVIIWIALLMNFKKNKPPFWLILPGVLLFSSYSLYPFNYLTLSLFTALVLLYVLPKEPPIKRLECSPPEKLIVLLIIAPIGLLLFQVWQAGHTFSITQRYLAFSVPYALMACGLVLRQVFSLSKAFQIAIFTVFLWQFVQVAWVLKGIYDDTNVKYSYFSKPREPNPYEATARKIMANYQTGDTLILPNRNLAGGTFADVDKANISTSVLDAQLLNLYFKKDAQYWQRIDNHEANKIFLVSKEGKKRLIFDLTDKRY